MPVSIHQSLSLTQTAKVPLTVDIDMVLRGQGADPVVIRQRSPRLVAAAERAIDLGQNLIAPQVAYRTLAVEAIRHARIELTGGHLLTGALLAQHLAPAQHITLMVCTIGPALEQQVSSL